MPYVQQLEEKILRELIHIKGSLRRHFPPQQIHQAKPLALPQIPAPLDPYIPTPKKH
jgi:hypothetical protein